MNSSDIDTVKHCEINMDKKLRMPTPKIAVIKPPITPNIAVKSFVPRIQQVTNNAQPVNYSEIKESSQIVNYERIFTPKYLPTNIRQPVTSNIHRPNTLPTFFQANVIRHLFLPNIGKQRPKRDVWLPPKTTGCKNTKNMTMTPIRTVPSVPTSTARLTQSRFMSRAPYLNIVTEKTDPIFNVSIYLDCTKEQDQPYNYVSERMRSITQNTISLKKQYSNVFRPLLNINGKVNERLFEESLSIYENNQVFYQDRIDDKLMDVATISYGLTQLEYWFMFIIEPRPTIRHEIIAWQKRESSKINNGLSAYCDPELYPYIQRMPDNMRQQLSKMYY